MSELNRSGVRELPDGRRVVTGLDQNGSSVDFVVFNPVPRNTRYRGLMPNMNPESWPSTVSGITYGSEYARYLESVPVPHLTGDLLELDKNITHHFALYMDPVETALRGARRARDEAVQKYHEHAAKLHEAGALELDPRGVALQESLELAQHNWNVFTNMSFRCEEAAWSDLEHGLFDPEHATRDAIAIANYRPNPGQFGQSLHPGASI